MGACCRLCHRQPLPLCGSGSGCRRCRRPLPFSVLVVIAVSGGHGWQSLYLHDGGWSSRCCVAVAVLGAEKKQDKDREDREDRDRDQRDR